MKVKVGDTVYDGKCVPIMVILTDEDKRNIGNMLPECNRYVEFPEGSPPDDIDQWMEEQ